MNFFFSHKKTLAAELERDMPDVGYIELYF